MSWPWLQAHGRQISKTGPGRLRGKERAVPVEGSRRSTPRKPWRPLQRDDVESTKQVGRLFVRRVIANGTKASTLRILPLKGDEGAPLSPTPFIQPVIYQASPVLLKHICGLSCLLFVNRCLARRGGLPERGVVPFSRCSSAG